MKPIKKKAAQRSAMDIANIALRKARKMERDLLISMKNSALIETIPKKFKLPDPPSGHEYGPEAPEPRALRPGQRDAAGPKCGRHGPLRGRGSAPRQDGHRRHEAAELRHRKAVQQVHH